MGLTKKILMWIAIWTAILFIFIFAFSVVATVIVATGLGAVASGNSMMVMTATFFVSPLGLTIWVIGIATICAIGLLTAKRKLEAGGKI